MPNLRGHFQSNAQFQFLSHDHSWSRPTCLSVPMYHCTSTYPVSDPTPLFQELHLSQMRAAIVLQTDHNLSAYSPCYLHTLLFTPHKMPSLNFACGKAIYLSRASAAVIFSVKSQVSPASKHIFLLGRICCTNYVAYSYPLCISITNLCVLNYQ